MISKYEEKTRDLIKDMTVEELEYVLYRYCGPSQVLLSEKTFGFQPSKKIVQQVLEIKQVEKFLLGAEDI